MTTIVPQMAKLSVKDLLETRQRLEADIDKLLTDFTALTGVEVADLDFNEYGSASGTVWTATIGTSHFVSQPSTGRVSVELAL